jgi:hypothetical protein
MSDEMHNLIISTLQEQGRKIDKLLEEVAVIRTKVYFFSVIGGMLAGFIVTMISNYLIKR